MQTKNGKFKSRCRKRKGMEDETHAGMYNDEKNPHRISNNSVGGVRGVDFHVSWYIVEVQGQI